MTTATRTRSEQRTEFLTDVLITAIEGGVAYWARVLEYQHTEAPRAVLVRTEDLAFDDNRFAWVPTDGAEQLVVDLDVVARGVNRIAPKNKKWSPWEGGGSGGRAISRRPSRHEPRPAASSTLRTRRNLAKPAGPLSRLTPERPTGIASQTR